MKRTVGIFETKDLALMAVKRLKEEGSAEKEISVMLKDLEWMDPRRLAMEENKLVRRSAKEISQLEECSTEEFFIAMGAIVAPLGGPLLAAGPISEAVRSSDRGRSIGLKEVLSLYDFYEDHPDHDLERIEKGHVLVLVDEDQIHEEKKILD